jgi:5'-methylthioadenosine phosphorylase
MEKDEDQHSMFELLNTIRRLMNHVGPHRTKIGATIMMSPIHHQTLFYIIHHPDCKMNDIAQGFHLSPAAVTRTVDNLIETGLVERILDPSDRRIIRVRMTEKGSKTIHEGMQQIGGMLSGVIKRMEKEDYDSLVRGMKALDKALDEEDAEK